MSLFQGCPACPDVYFYVMFRKMIQMVARSTLQLMGTIGFVENQTVGKSQILELLKLITSLFQVYHLLQTTGFLGKDVEFTQKPVKL